MSRWNGCSQTFRKHLLRKMPTNSDNKTTDSYDHIQQSRNNSYVKIQNNRIQLAKSNQISHSKTCAMSIPKANPIKTYEEQSPAQQIKIIPEPFDTQPHSLQTDNFLMVDSAFMRVAQSKIPNDQVKHHEPATNRSIHPFDNNSLCSAPNAQLRINFANPTNRTFENSLIFDQMVSYHETNTQTDNDE